MEQSAGQQPTPQPASSAAAREQQDPAFAAIVASIEGLDGLGLVDEHGRTLGEPASAFHWS